MKFSEMKYERPDLEAMKSELRGLTEQLRAAQDYAQAREVFDRLRAFDETDVRQIWAQCPSDEGLGLAVANRIKKAAGFAVIEL